MLTTECPGGVGKCTSDCAEWVDYDVTLTIRASTRIPFAPMHRDRPISKSDAIENALGSGIDDIIEALQDLGFAVAMPIDGDAVRES